LTLDIILGIFKFTMESDFVYFRKANRYRVYKGGSRNFRREDMRAELPAARGNGRRSPGGLRAELPEANDFSRFEHKITHFGDIFSDFTTKTHFLNNFMLCKFKHRGSKPLNPPLQ